MRIQYNPQLKHMASNLRQRKRTYAERMLWYGLKNRQMMGYKFIRQKPIGNFIADFFCPELDLVIEIDGISHEGKEQYDQKRENYLKNLGLNVLRFTDEDVKNNTEGTLKEIQIFIQNLTKQAR
jgi:very-short-patch-repair endonuclease